MLVRIIVLGLVRPLIILSVLILSDLILSVLFLLAVLIMTLGMSVATLSAVLSLSVLSIFPQARGMSPPCNFRVGEIDLADFLGVGRINWFNKDT